MDRVTYIMKKGLQEFKEDLKSLLTEDFKEKDPDTYYQLTSIINKYYGKNPYEDDVDINMKNITPTNEDCLCCAAKDKYIEWLQKRVTEWYDFKNNKPAPCHPYEQNIGIIFQLEIGYIGYGIYNIISKNVWQGSNRVDTDKIVRWCYLPEPLEEY